VFDYIFLLYLHPIATTNVTDQSFALSNYRRFNKIVYFRRLSFTIDAILSVVTINDTQFRAQKLKEPVCPYAIHSRIISWSSLGSWYFEIMAVCILRNSHLRGCCSQFRYRCSWKRRVWPIYCAGTFYYGWTTPVDQGHLVSEASWSRCVRHNSQ
jgi:hypothetical protein